MARIDTLTAYKCNFSFLQRNNPLIKEQKEAIKSEQKPIFSISDFINSYKEYTKGIAVGQSTNRAISLAEHKFICEYNDGIKKWHIILNAGKQGQPVTVVKMSNKKQYDYGADTAALYGHHVYFYEKEDYFIAIFHRQNGSGCKGVFLETANNSIKQYGIKLEMTLIAPVVDKISNATPTKITLQYKKQITSSDPADNINRNYKSYTIRDLGLNLSVIENTKISQIFNALQLHIISQDEAFALIKAEVDNSNDYNDAEVILKVGKSRKKVKWNDFESAMGSYDISEKLHSSYIASKDFEHELSKIVDEYYNIIAAKEI